MSKLGGIYGENTEIIMVGETKGVLDEKGEVVPVINEENLKSLEKVFFAQKGIDVTVGMYQKVKELLEISNRVKKVLITDLEGFRNILADKEYQATKIT